MRIRAVRINCSSQLIDQLLLILSTYPQLSHLQYALFGPETETVPGNHPTVPTAAFRGAQNGASTRQSVSSTAGLHYNTNTVTFCMDTLYDHLGRQKEIGHMK